MWILIRQLFRPRSYDTETNRAFAHGQLIADQHYQLGLSTDLIRSALLEEDTDDE